jgi:hypothetical protein
MTVSSTGIEGSKPTRGMYVCLRFYMLWSPVYVEILQRTDPPSKELYQVCKQIHNFGSICELEQDIGPNL